MPEDIYARYIATYACGHTRVFEIPNACDVPLLQAMAAEADCPECVDHKIVRAWAREQAAAR